MLTPALAEPKLFKLVDELESDLHAPVTRQLE